MGDIKKRIARISARIDATGDQGPRTYADFVKWETVRRQANGGELTPAQAAWINAKYQRWYDQESARLGDRTGGRGSRRR